jgi:uncharacterized protein (TIGR02453 family)
MPGPYVTRDLFRFFDELRRHNDRAWFDVNRDWYLAGVRDPLLGFVAAIAPRLRAISPHIVADARPWRGSLRRIHRDTRFSRDKTPYRTGAGLSFPLRAARDVEAPGYYLHLEPGRVFVGAGMWRPGGDTLHAIREAIVANPAGWKRASRSGLARGEPALKRSPRGFDPEHPLADDLKRLSFTVTVPFTERQACAPDFPARVVAACRREAPLVRFLARALGLGF